MYGGSGAMLLHMLAVLEARVGLQEKALVAERLDALTQFAHAPERDALQTHWQQAYIYDNQALRGVRRVCTYGKITYCGSFCG